MRGKQSFAKAKYKFLNSRMSNKLNYANSL